MQGIRTYQADDLAWIEPIARKYGEWEAVKDVLTTTKLVSALVVESKAIVAVYRDEHGFVGVGLCDRHGIKELFVLGRKLTRIMNGTGVDVHTHVAEGTWQYQMFLRLGYVESWPDGVLKAYAVKEVA